MKFRANFTASLHFKFSPLQTSLILLEIHSTLSWNVIDANLVDALRTRIGLNEINVTYFQRSHYSTALHDICPKLFLIDSVRQQIINLYLNLHQPCEFHNHLRLFEGWDLSIYMPLLCTFEVRHFRPLRNQRNLALLIHSLCRAVQATLDMRKQSNMDEVA